MIVLKATQDKVLAALQSVAGIVERRHTLPILANVLIRKTGGQLQLTTSDLEIQIRTTAELGGDEGNFTTTIGARKLIDILRTMPADQTVSLESSASKLVLKGGKSRFTLQSLPAEDFPLVQEAANFGPVFSVPQKTLKDLLSQVSFAMAVHDIRYYLNGILFVAEGKQLSLVATDGHRLAFSSATLDVEVPRQEVILPRKTVLEMQRLLSDAEGAIEMQFANNQAKFSFGGMEFVTKLVEGKFPDYNRVIPKNHKNTVTLGRAPLAGQPAAHRHPDQREVQGRAPEHRAGHAAHRLEQRRAGRSAGRARHRLRRRRHRDRLQRDLPDRRAVEHGPGHGQARPGRLQQLRVADHPRERILQVRRDADAYLADRHRSALRTQPAALRGFALSRGGELSF
jgi:DNA polymerase-3 subunit beta